MAKKGKKAKIENRDTYFLGVSRGKSKRYHAIKIGICTRGKLATRISNLQTGSNESEEGWPQIDDDID